MMITSVVSILQCFLLHSIFFTKGSLPTGYLEFYFAKPRGGLDPLSLNDQEKGTPPLPPPHPLLPSPDQMVPSFHLDRGWFSEWLNIVIIIIVIIIYNIIIVIVIIIITIIIIIYNIVIAIAIISIIIIINIIIIIIVIIVVIRLPKRSVVYDLLRFLMFI